MDKKARRAQKVMDSANPLARGSIIFGLELSRSTTSGSRIASPSIWEEERTIMGNKVSLVTNRATGEFKLEDYVEPTQATPTTLYSKLSSRLTFTAPRTTAEEVSPPVVVHGQLKHTSSWRNAVSPLRAGRCVAQFSDIAHLYRNLKNVREPKIGPMFADMEESTLYQVEFENNSMSLDELEICAALMLERIAPAQCLSSQQGMQCLAELVSTVRLQFKKPNPYHDFRHAVDGMQFMFHLLHREDVAEQLLGEELTKFLLLIACLMQDLQHDGKTNAIHRLNGSEDELIREYGEESPLERMHYVCAERVLKESKLFEFLRLPDETKSLFKLRALILCTDFDMHDKYMLQFTTQPTASSVFFALMKLCDVCNVTREFDEARVWARRLEAETKMNLGTSVGGGNDTLAAAVVSFSQEKVLPLCLAMETNLGMEHTGRTMAWRIESNIYRWNRERNSTSISNPGL